MQLSQRKIAKLTVETGHVRPGQIDHRLRMRRLLMTAVRMAVVSISCLIGAIPEVHAGSPLLSTNIGIHARVLEHTSMEIISQARELTITNADMRRGSIDVPAASRVLVKSNNPAGYLLTFEVNGPCPLLSSVLVNVGGREFQLAPTGGWVLLPYTRGCAALEISYRFTLSGQARPGTYTWPLTVSVNPR